MKSIIIFLLIFISNNIIYSQESQQNFNPLTIDEVLKKYNITDLKTASMDQLCSAHNQLFDEAEKISKKEDKEPYFKMRDEIDKFRKLLPEYSPEKIMENIYQWKYQKYINKIALDPNNAKNYISKAHYAKKLNLTIKEQLADVTKAIQIDPNNSSYYIVRAKIDTDMMEITNSTKWSEENKNRIYTLLLNGYKNDFYDYSKAIDLEPNKKEYREYRINMYKSSYEESFDNRETFDIRDSIIQDLTKLIELENNDLKSLSYFYKRAQFNYEKALNTKNNTFATSSLNDFLKINSIDVKNEYSVLNEILNLYKLIRKYDVGIVFLNNCIISEIDSEKKNDLIIEKGKFYYSLYKENIGNENLKLAYSEIDKVINPLDSQINKNPNSLDLLGKRIEMTIKINIENYYPLAFDYMNKINNIYKTNIKDCEENSSIYYILLNKPNNKEVETILNELNNSCYNNKRKILNLKEESLLALNIVSGLEGYKTFVSFYREKKGLGDF